jgi:dihydropteroate synthase
MRAGVAAGANMLNDIRALREAGALQAAAELGVPVCLMHMRGAPRTMQAQAIYENVTAAAFDFLSERIVACEKAGICRELIVVDPGFGFGKNDEHNLELLANLGRLRALGCPILAGLSRKRTLGALTGREVDDRKDASVAAATIAVMHGATIIRAHDVAATVDAVRVATAVLNAG